MKKILLTTMLTLISISSLAQQTFDNPTYSKDAIYNLRLHPIALAVGAGIVDLDIKIDQHWTLGPELMYWNVNVSQSGNNSGKIDLNYSSFGLRLNWFKQGVYSDGMYVAPFLRYGKTKVDTAGSTTVTGDASGVALGADLGYGWFWNSYNLMIGVGFAAASGQSTLVATDSNGNRTELPNKGVGPSGEISMGWTF